MTPNISPPLWLNALVPISATIQQAIFSLERSSMQIVLVVTEGNKLVGTVTDGDVRRAFLKGFGMESSIENALNRNPLVVPPEIGRELILQLMHANRIHQLPVVDADGVVLGLHVWDSILVSDSLENIMVIMAGGKGTRLHPLTESCPKPMLEVGGKPMLEHIIERAKSDGFQNFVISVHYLGEMIEKYFGDGNKIGVNIEYLREDSPLGTAGSLSMLKSQPQKPFIVTNGDVLAGIHYKEMLDFHLLHNATATMAVRQHEMQNQFGVVNTRGIEIEGFEEKPIYRSHINAGIYALNPEALTLLEERQHCNMPSLFERIKMSGGRAIVYPIHEPWLDVGRHSDFDLAQKKHYIF
jgi:dTDP-glucose pyrophosphorylase/predicted transcriptional regulator